MTKREMIDQIRRLNHSARPDFLARFNEKHLLDYLHQLKELQFEYRTDDLLRPMTLPAN